jgi:hypothetical protein
MQYILTVVSEAQSLLEYTEQITGGETQLALLLNVNGI